MKNKSQHIPRKLDSIEDSFVAVSYESCGDVYFEALHKVLRPVRRALGRGYFEAVRDHLKSTLSNGRIR